MPTSGSSRSGASCFPGAARAPPPPPAPAPAARAPPPPRGRAPRPPPPGPARPGWGGRRGGGPPPPRLHVARTVCRRAERRAVALARAQEASPAALAYLNRLSDLLFILARAANAEAGLPEPLWKPGASR